MLRWAQASSLLLLNMHMALKRLNKLLCVLLLARTQMEDRMTLCNMVIEGGGKNGIVAADKTTFAYLEVTEL